MTAGHDATRSGRKANP